MPEIGVEAFAIALAAFGMIALVTALRRLLRVRFFAAAKSSVIGFVLLGMATALFVVSSNLSSYARLTHEAPVADLAFEEMGPKLYRATLTRLPTGEIQSFALYGDDWQLDARVIKWLGVANLLGLDALYRLERVSGRYGDVDQERSEPRSVHSLAAPHTLDLWALARANPKWLPFVDALYGSATYLPMADGAHYRVTISQSGLVARPTNDAAEQATSAWR